MTEFGGKVVCVTGAGSGIGRATALRFLEEGASVLAVDMDEAALSDLADENNVDRDRVLTQNGDTSDESTVRVSVKLCLEHFGGLDVFFANAGISGPLMPLDQTSAEDLRRIIDVNLLGPLFAVKWVAPVMARNGGGAIILTGSVAGFGANASPLPYAATKAAVNNIAKTAAQEFGGYGVRVNAVCPGVVETGMTRSMFERARERGTEERISSINPCRRVGRTDDIAEAVLFLASERANYVNGHGLVVDGGLTSSLPYLPNKIIQAKVE